MRRPPPLSASSRRPSYREGTPAVYIPLVQRHGASVPTCEVLDHEPNNVFLDADNNLPLCPEREVPGTVAPTTDVNDIYRILTTESGTLLVTLAGIPTGADYDLYLYDARGGSGQLAVSNTPGSSPEQIRLSVPAGRYYLRVVSFQYAGANTYDLQWQYE